MSDRCVACGEIAEGKPLYKKLGSSDCQVEVFTALHEMQLLSLPPEEKNDHYICWDCDETIAEEYATFLKSEAKKQAESAKRKQQDEARKVKLQRKLKQAFKRAHEDALRASGVAPPVSEYKRKEKQRQENRYYASHCLLCKCSFEATKSRGYQRFTLQKMVDDDCDVSQVLQKLGLQINVTEAQKRKRFVCCQCYNKMRRNYKAKTRGEIDWSNPDSNAPVAFNSSQLNEHSQSIFKRRPTAEEHAAEIAKLIPPSLANLYKVVTKEEPPKRDNKPCSSSSPKVPNRVKIKGIITPKKEIKSTAHTSSSSSSSENSSSASSSDTDDESASDSENPASPKKCNKLTNSQNEVKKEKFIYKIVNPVKSNAPFNSISPQICAANLKNNGIHISVRESPKTSTIRTLTPKNVDDKGSMGGKSILNSKSTSADITDFGICNLCGLGYNSRPKNFWYTLKTYMPSVSGVTVSDALQILDSALADVSVSVREKELVCKPCYSRVCGGFRSQILQRIAEKKGMEVDKLELSKIKIKMFSAADNSESPEVAPGQSNKPPPKTASADPLSALNEAKDLKLLKENKINNSICSANSPLKNKKKPQEVAVDKNSLGIKNPVSQVVKLDEVKLMPKSSLPAAGIMKSPIKKIKNEERKKEVIDKKETKLCNGDLTNSSNVQNNHQEMPQKFIENVNRAFPNIKKHSLNEDSILKIKFKRCKKSLIFPNSKINQDMDLIGLINKSKHLRYKGKAVLLNNVNVNIVDLKELLPKSAYKKEYVRLELLNDAHIYSNFLRNLKCMPDWNLCILCQKKKLGLKITTRWLEDPVSPPNLMVPLRWAHLSLGNSDNSNLKANLAIDDGKVCEECHRALKMSFGKFVGAKVANSHGLKSEKVVLDKYKVSFDSAAMNIVADPLIFISPKKKPKSNPKVDEEEKTLHTHCDKENEKRKSGNESSHSHSEKDHVKCINETLLTKNNKENEKSDPEALHTYSNEEIMKSNGETSHVHSKENVKGNGELKILDENETKKLAIYENLEKCIAKKSKKMLKDSNLPNGHLKESKASSNKEKIPHVKMVSVKDCVSSLPNKQTVVSTKNTPTKEKKLIDDDRDTLAMDLNISDTSDSESDKTANEENNSSRSDSASKESVNCSDKKTLKVIQKVHIENGYKGADTSKSNESVEDVDTLKSSECVKGADTLKSNECVKGADTLKSSQSVQDADDLKSTESVEDADTLKSNEIFEDANTLKSNERFEDANTLKSNERFEDANTLKSNESNDCNLTKDEKEANKNFNQFQATDGHNCNPIIFDDMNTKSINESDAKNVNQFGNSSVLEKIAAVEPLCMVTKKDNFVPTELPSVLSKKNTEHCLSSIPTLESTSTICISKQHQQEDLRNLEKSENPSLDKPSDSSLLNIVNDLNTESDIVVKNKTMVEQKLLSSREECLHSDSGEENPLNRISSETYKETSKESMNESLSSTRKGSEEENEQTKKESESQSCDSLTMKLICNEENSQEKCKNIGDGLLKRKNDPTSNEINSGTFNKETHSKSVKESISLVKNNKHKEKNHVEEFQSNNFKNSDSSKSKFIAKKKCFENGNKKEKTKLPEKSVSMKRKKMDYSGSSSLCNDSFSPSRIEPFDSSVASDSTESRIEPCDSSVSSDCTASLHIADLADDCYQEDIIGEDTIAPFAQRKRFKGKQRPTLCPPQLDDACLPEAGKVQTQKEDPSTCLESIWQTIQGISLDDLMMKDIHQPLRLFQYNAGLLLALNDMRIHLGASIEDLIIWLKRLLPLEMKEKGLEPCIEKFSIYLFSLSNPSEELNGRKLNKILPEDLFLQRFQDKDSPSSDYQSVDRCFIKDIMEESYQNIVDLSWDDFLSPVNIDKLLEGKLNRVSWGDFNNGLLYALWRVNKLLLRKEEDFVKFLPLTSTTVMKDKDYDAMSKAATAIDKHLRNFPCEVARLIAPIVIKSKLIKTDPEKELPVVNSEKSVVIVNKDTVLKENYNSKLDSAFNSKDIGLQIANSSSFPVNSNFICMPSGDEYKFNSNRNLSYKRSIDTRNDSFPLKKTARVLPQLPVENNAYPSTTPTLDESLINQLALGKKSQVLYKNQAEFSGQRTKNLTYGHKSQGSGDIEADVPDKNLNFIHKYRGKDNDLATVSDILTNTTTNLSLSNKIKTQGKDTNQIDVPVIVTEISKNLGSNSDKILCGNRQSSRVVNTQYPTGNNVGLYRNISQSRMNTNYAQFGCRGEGNIVENINNNNSSQDFTLPIISGVRSNSGSLSPELTAVSSRVSNQIPKLRENCGQNAPVLITQYQPGIQNTQYDSNIQFLNTNASIVSPATYVIQNSTSTENSCNVLKSHSILPLQSNNLPKNIPVTINNSITIVGPQSFMPTAVPSSNLQPTPSPHSSGVSFLPFVSPSGLMTMLSIPVQMQTVPIANSSIIRYRNPPPVTIQSKLEPMLNQGNPPQKVDDKPVGNELATKVSSLERQLQEVQKQNSKLLQMNQKLLDITLKETGVMEIEKSLQTRSSESIKPTIDSDSISVVDVVNTSVAESGNIGKLASKKPLINEVCNVSDPYSKRSSDRLSVRKKTKPSFEDALNYKYKK